MTRLLRDRVTVACVLLGAICVLPPASYAQQPSSDIDVSNLQLARPTQVDA